MTISQKIKELNEQGLELIGFTLKELEKFTNDNFYSLNSEIWESESNSEVFITEHIQVIISNDKKHFTIIHTYELRDWNSFFGVSVFMGHNCVNVVNNKTLEVANIFI